MIAAAAIAVLLASAAPAATDATSARALFERAEVKFNLGNFQGAAADYQAAYELDHRPALLFDVGQCYRNLGDYERARFYYRRFLTLDPRTPTRRDTERLVDLMSKRLNEQATGARLAVSARGPASELGAPPAFAPTLERTDRPDSPARPIYRRSWFWIGVAGALAGGVAAGLLLSRDDPHGSLSSIDLR